MILIANSERLIPNRNFNTKEIKECVGLPNESPTYLMFKIVESQEKKEALEILLPIIGTLPFSDQQALFSIMDSTNANKNLFDFSNYLANLQAKPEIVHNQQKSLSEMLSANAKRIRAGLGCITKVTNEFQRHSGEDDLLVQNINDNNQKILQASNQLNHCEMNFLKALFTTLNKRKGLLSLITTDNYKTPIISVPDYFTRDSKTNAITGIKYSNGDMTAIVDAFKDYGTCHQAFNNIVHRLGLENIASIAQMKHCLDEDKPNKNSGKSSKEYKNPSINYKDKEIIGINNATGIRTDRLTQNNYMLNHGYRFGKINTELNIETDMPMLPISIEWLAKINGAISTASTVALSDGKSYLEAIIKNPSSRRPFANLAELLIHLSTGSSKNDVYKLLYSPCETGFNYVECNLIKDCTTSSTITGLNLKLTSENKLFGDDNFAMSNPYLTIMCDNNIKKIYSHATSKIAGDVFDYYEKDSSIGIDLANINQACFGVFTSGGKNDKDACRDSMNEQCGSELDYRCKESGLYDIINQNPPTKTILPSACFDTATEKTCFEWIEKRFVMGTVSVRPSEFISYSLDVQLEKNFDISMNTINYIKPDYIAAYSLSDLGKLDLLIDSNLFYIEENTATTFSDIGKFYIEIDRTLQIQSNQSFNIISPLNFFTFSLLISVLL